MPDKIELQIAYPPDFVFKYRRPSRVIPSQEVMTKNGIFDFTGVKYPPIYHETDDFFEKSGLKREWFKYPVSFAQGPKGEQMIAIHDNYPELTTEEEAMGGQLSCFKDVPFPYKGHPFPQAMHSVNVAKRYTRELIDFYASRPLLPFFILFFFLTKNRKKAVLEKFIKSYSWTTRKAMETYILREEYMSKYGRELGRFISNALVAWGIEATSAADFAECVASQIDWDNAYWMRLGDTMANTTKEAMMKDARSELKKLAAIIIERNPQDKGTAARIARMIRLISWMLLIPRYKRIFRDAVAKSEFSNLQFDDADRYHCLLYEDYNYLGLSIDERMKKWQDYHKEHPPLPKRYEMQP